MAALLIQPARETWRLLRWSTWRRQHQHRAKAAAATRHCFLLLLEIEQAAAAGLDTAVAILGRVFTEAWLTALYIQLGGHEALQRVAQDTAHQVKLTDNDLKEFDERLKHAKKNAATRIRKVRATNAGISGRNAANPELPPRPLHQEPRVPQLTGLCSERCFRPDTPG